MVTRLIKKVIARLRKPSKDDDKAKSRPSQAAHAVETHRPKDQKESWQPVRPHAEGEPVHAPRADSPQQQEQPTHRDQREQREHPGHDQRPRRSRAPRPPREHSARAEEPPAPPPPPAEPWDPASFAVPVADGKTRFQDMDLPQEIMHAIADLKFQYCTPIQARSLPETLQGRDIFGKAQTGTGKTAAFLITALTKLLRQPRTEAARRGTPRVLVLAPTRELCLQIHKDAVALGKYCGFKTVAVFGGMDYDKQRRQLSEERVDIVVATPGRLLDFKKKQDIHLSRVEILVIDEADRMLDMGFIPDVREIVYSTPPKARRQTLFYSATLTPEIQRLSASWTHEPVSIEIAPENVAVDTVDQKVFIVTTQEKFALLLHILTRPDATRVIVFCNRRVSSDRLKDALRRYGIECGLLSGDVPQDKRLRTLEGFRSGKFRVLVATDVAGRGIHVEGVSHVVNFNMPEDPEDYVHRIGRTGRAGALGQSISFACEEDSFAIPGIEKYLGRPLTFDHPEDAWLKLPEPPDGQSIPAAFEEDDGPRGRPPRRGGPRSGGRRGGPPGRRGPPRR